VRCFPKKMPQKRLEKAADPLEKRLKKRRGPKRTGIGGCLFGKRYKKPQEVKKLEGEGKSFRRNASHINRYLENPKRTFPHTYTKVPRQRGSFFPDQDPLESKDFPNVCNQKGGKEKGNGREKNQMGARNREPIWRVKKKGSLRRGKRRFGKGGGDRRKGVKPCCGPLGTLWKKRGGGKRNPYGKKKGGRSPKRGTPLGHYIGWKKKVVPGRKGGDYRKKKEEKCLTAKKAPIGHRGKKGA